MTKQTDIARLIDILDNATFVGKIEALAIAQKIQAKGSKKEAETSDKK